MIDEEKNGNIGPASKRGGLILTRRIGESIMIGEDVVVTVNGVHGLQVRLQISAPMDVAIHREEIYNRIKRGAI